MVTFGSLFAGIGGFDLGFERAGMVPVWQAEIDDKCQQVLAHHWPNVRQLGDVKNVGTGTPTVDVICGGFPCQDLSVAGKREGLSGERSGLWFEFLRVVEELAPKWVVIENVPGLLSSYSGDDPPSDLQPGQRWETTEESDLAVILRGLGECGYWWAYRVYDAQYFRVPQRRRRVFIVASLGNGRAAEVLFERESSAWDSAPSRETGQAITQSLTGGARTLRAEGADASEDGTGRGTPLIVTGFDRTQGTESGPIAGPLRACGGKSDGVNDGKADVQCVAFQQNQRNEVRKIGGDGTIAGSLAAEPGMKQQNYIALAFTERTRDQGRTLETQDELAYALTNPGSGGRTHSRQIAGTFGVRRLTPRECERLQGFPDDWTAIDGMSDSARYRMLGNAVAVPCAEWIGRRIVSI